jgi:hypothetical protein
MSEMNWNALNVTQLKERKCITDEISPNRQNDADPGSSDAAQAAESSTCWATMRQTMQTTVLSYKVSVW